jgi:hypothetical protein
MGHEAPLPLGYHYLFLRCQKCGLRKRLVVPAYPLKIGSVLPVQGYGAPAASCVRCKAARLEVLNEPPPPPDPPPPRGFVKKPGVDDQ